MKTLSIREMRASLGRLDARVVPFEASWRISSREDLRRSMPRLSSSADLIREDRDGYRVLATADLKMASAAADLGLEVKQFS